MKKTAIIGCGNIANVHAKALLQLPELQIVALCDSDLEKARHFASQYAPNAELFADYQEMLKCTKPDVIHICTPHNLHVPMALAALRQDIHVFMEKPPAITSTEFAQLKDTVKNSRAGIGFCFQNRYNATTKALDSYVASSSLGTLLGGRAIVTWRRDANYYSDDWHGRLETEGGGALMNQSIHTLDLLLRYMGKPLQIKASAHNHHLPGVITVEDTIEAWMEFENGRRACFYASTGYAEDAPVILELTFTGGRITMLGSDLYITEKGQPTQPITVTDAPAPGKSYWGSGHLRCIQDYYNCLQQNTPFPNNLDGVENTVATTLKIYETVRKKEK